MNIEGTLVEENVISHDGRIKLSIIENKRICETLYEMRLYYPDTILFEATVDTMIDDLMTIWFVKSFGNNKEDNIIAFGLSDICDRVSIPDLSVYSEEIMSLNSYIFLPYIQRPIYLHYQPINRYDYIAYRSLQKIRSDHII